MITMPTQAETWNESRPVILNGFSSLVAYYLDKRKIVNDNILIPNVLPSLIPPSCIDRPTEKNMRYPVVCT